MTHSDSRQEHHDWEPVRTARDQLEAEMWRERLDSLAIPALVGFFLFVGLSPRADEPAGGAGAEAGTDRTSTRTEGVWGERQT